ncbi:alpha/beta hydrolase [Aureivirga marina]|uniref:alpha/beta hydrolase n=1 Tax=Aureivirga marina TaxID=1182451 RepID=UPI0018C94620|nr:alpha/beta hydrolase [Aureivirga marina]
MKKVILIFIFSCFCVSILFSQENKNELQAIENITYANFKHKDSVYTKLNLILPKNVENPPILIWIGGGAWAYVDRHKEMGLCRKLAEKGIAVISVGHRLSPALLGRKDDKAEGIQHPEHIKDIVKAFKWIINNGEKYGMDVENIYVGGYSSGAHLSCLLAADKKYVENLGLKTTNIRGIIPIGGAYDIPFYKELLISVEPSYLEKHIEPVFGKTNEQHKDASPITFIENLKLPIFLIDEGQTYVYNQEFEKKLLEQGNLQIQSLHLYNETHASLWTKLSNEKEYVVREMIVEFIQKYKK